MTYVVHGATGAQGAPVAAALVRAGKNAIAAVRDPAAYAGAGTPVAVDLASVDTLESAYRDAQGVFIHLPQSTPEQQSAYVANVIEAAVRTRLPRVVVSTSGLPLSIPGAENSAIAQLIRGLQAGPAAVAVVEPRLYLENLLLPLWGDPGRVGETLKYPLRDDYAVSWSSHLDIADVVVRLFDEPSITGVVGVGALPGLVGADLAAGFSRYLDREVRFEAQDPDDFGAVVTPLFGKAGADAVVASYHARQNQPGDVIPADSSAQKLLGLEPRTVEQWLRDR